MPKNPRADEDDGAGPLPLRPSFSPAYGQAVAVAPSILRITAQNPSPFTFYGTNSYVVGTDRCVVVDPGPALDAHVTALVAAIAHRPVDAILLTHTHRDHTGAVRKLQELTGAPVLAEGPHRPARPLFDGEAQRLDAAGDTELRADRFVADGDILDLGDVPIGVVATPGHCVNHLAFAIGDDGVVLTGDHVMAWSTTIVAPPDGSMQSYMASLERLLARNDRYYLPGHGGPVERPATFVRALIAHRRMREKAIVERLAAGDRTIGEIVAVLYRDTDPQLHGAAGLSVLAHLEDLIARGRVVGDCLGTANARFRIA